MEENLSLIKSWLATGSLNIFGLPMSGKDTQGVRLAEALGAKFLSSGLIIRTMEAEQHKDYTGSGALAPTDIFYELVLPYFSRADLADYPLVLSSVGRWQGEENAVMQSAAEADHPIKVALLLNISEADVVNRFKAALSLQDRGKRQDDKDLATFEVRLKEFRTKTMPVIEHYRELGLLVNINGDQPRDVVFSEIITKLAEYAERA